MPLNECPECHVSFEGLSGEEVQEHRNHWPDEIAFPTANAEAIRRSKAVADEAADRKLKERQAEARRTLSKE